MASLQAGIAFSNAILGAVHAMSHSIGGRYPMLHGDVNAVLLPHVMEFNLLAAPQRFREIAELLYEKIKKSSSPLISPDKQMYFSPKSALLFFEQKAI